MTYRAALTSRLIGSGPKFRRARALNLLLLFAFVLGCSIPPGKVRIPPRPEGRVSQNGIASWYGPGFHGKATASGDVSDQNELTAAHQTLPLGTRVMVTNMENGSATEVTITDRGPFAKGRIIDLSYAAAERLGIREQGRARVRLDQLVQMAILSTDSPSRN